MYRPMLLHFKHHFKVVDKRLVGCGFYRMSSRRQLHILKGAHSLCSKRVLRKPSRAFKASKRSISDKLAQSCKKLQPYIRRTSADVWLLNFCSHHQNLPWRHLPPAPAAGPGPCRPVAERRGVRRGLASLVWGQAASGDGEENGHGWGAPTEFQEIC